jgi:ankyrin repeat protein
VFFQIVSDSFTCLTSGGPGAEKHLHRVWDGIAQRFGVKKGKGNITKTQRDGISAIRAIQRVAKAVGVRLTPSCLDDLEHQLVDEDKAGKGGSRSFIFTAADVESMAPRVKFLDVDDFAQGETLREQARGDAEERGHVRPRESGEGELQVGDCCGFLCDDQEQKQKGKEQSIAQFTEQRQLAGWFSGRGRILAQCDAKFTAARATFGGGVFAAGKKPGHVQRAIASVRIGRVECLCLGGAATDTAAERTRPGVGWEARVRKVDAFAAIALIDGEGGGDGARSASEMKIEPTVALFTMLCEAKMAGVAWEGVEKHVLRSMEGGNGGREGRRKRGISSGGGDGGNGGGESKGGDERMGTGTAGGGDDCVRELLGRLLEVDYYGNAVREKVVEVFVGSNGEGGDGGAAIGGEVVVPSAVVRLLDEARWISLQVGDKVVAWNGIYNSDVWLATTVTKDHCDGTYAVEYEDSSQVAEAGNPTRASTEIMSSWGYSASLNGNRLELLKGGCDTDLRCNFRGRGKGTRAASLQNRPSVHDDPAAVGELLRWSRKDMGGTERIVPLVTIKPEQAIEAMWAAVRAEGGGDAVGLAFPCRNVGTGNVDAVDAERGTTCLHEIVETSDNMEEQLKVASLLLSQNANVDAQEKKDGKTSLHLAVEEGSMDLALLLIRNGAAVNLGDSNERTPLFAAAGGNRTDMVAMLVRDGGADVSKANKNGQTPLYSAALNGNTDVAAFLITEGKADVNQRENNGRTPLGIAAREGHVDVAALLVKEGTDVNLGKVDGFTPLLSAAQKGHANLVALLIAEDAVDVNQVTSKGATPLSIAGQRGRAEVVSLLVNKGKADVNKPMNDGASPLLMAAMVGHSEIVDVLLQHNAAPNQPKVRVKDQMHRNAVLE